MPTPPPPTAGPTPDAVVVSVGIGLDTRAERLAGALPPSVTWLGVDMPEVVDLRATLLPGTTPGSSPPRSPSPTGRSSCCPSQGSAGTWVGDHRVMERIGFGHRAAAGLFRLLALGAPAYSVARLRAAG
ncbi:hypothetical protein ABT234_32495 [Streptomyces sp. NPDC001586]|uniref:hypothetical protein n=1 Tax=Streptomyces sp. NPDC001586 TaxID=3154387 RepID=UPI00332C4AEE